MNLEELKQFLQRIGAAPRKSLSQNFLIDQNIVKKILRFADIQPGDFVLEIGPGPGALTTALLEAGAHVLAVEKDRLFAEHLPSHPNLRIISGDILKTELGDVTGWKVVANLPYHITAPILEKILPLPFASITIMIQSEVADRLAAKPKTPEYSSLTLFASCHAQIVDRFTVSPSCFYPQPKVESTVIRLDPKPLPDPNPIPWIRRAFQQRRKQLASSLKSIAPDVGAALHQCSLPPFARPEELSLPEWVSFAKELSKSVGQ